MQMSSPEGDELFLSLRMHYHIRHKGWYTNGFGHPLDISKSSVLKPIRYRPKNGRFKLINI